MIRSFTSFYLKSLPFFFLASFLSSVSFAQPANDVCSGAQAVNPNGTCYGGTTTAATDNWAGTVGCQSGNHVDTWYSFTATQSQLALNITNGTQTGNIEFILVSSATGCAGPFTLAGSSCGPSALVDTLNGLQAGTTYYFTISPTGAAGTYTVCVNNIAAVPIAGQDCPTAAILCDDNPFSQATSNAGFGTQEVNPVNSCWGIGGERQSKWFKFTIGCSGTLEFNINPVNSGDDYDWALWDVTANCPTTANGNVALACNWSGCKGSTGISSCSNFNMEPGANKAGAGCGGQYAAWEAGPLNVTCGKVYALLVDNFSTSNNGFTLTWGGACSPGGTAVIGPDAAFTVSSSNCNNTVTATKSCCTTPNFTYLWNFGDGFTATGPGPVTHTYTTIGTYIISLTVTDQLGCQKFSSVTISQTSVSSTIAQSNATCNGGTNGSATVTPTSGNPAYTYVWSPVGGTSSAATGLSAGNYTVTITDANGCTGTKTVTITQPSVLTNSVSSSVNVLCNGGSNGSATVAAGGGTPAYTYNWSNGQTTSTATGLSAGNYTATVTDANGCTRTATLSITQPAALTVTTSSTNAACGTPNGTASATAGGGTPSYSYSWNNGQTTTTATGLIAGSYTITVTDGNGCTQTSIANVSNAGSPTLTITSSTNVSCNGGNNGTASVTASGGSPAYTYSWCNGQTTSSATGLSAGSCNVTVTDGLGCVSIIAVPITQPAVLTASLSSTAVSCNGGNNGSASVTSGGGTPSYTYSWSNGQTATTATGLSSGNYTVTITDGNNCTTTGTVSVAQPAALTTSISSQTNVSCGGGNNGSASVAAGGGTPSYTYSWTNGQTASAATGLSSGNYTVTITDANGCTGTQTVSITQPAVLTSTMTQTNVSCNGGSNGAATVTPGGGTSPFTYSWSNGTSTSANTGLTTGIYSVTVTDANGCSASSTVTITEPAALTATTTASPSGCAASNGSATTTPSGGNPAYSYLWSNGQTTSTATGLSAGSYTITITDGSGCTFIDVATVVNSGAPTVILTPTGVTCNGGTNGNATANASGGTPPYTYSWNNGQTTSVATGLSAGSYTLTLTDAGGCIQITTVTVNQPSALSGGISSQTNVSCNGGSNGTATVAASGGSPAYSYLWSNGQTTTTATGLSAGNYTVTLTDANGCTSTTVAFITQPAALTNTITTTTPGCAIANGTATANPGGGSPSYTYLWNNGQTTQTATGLALGNYTITLTDANGCTLNDIVTLSNTTPSVTVSSASVSCNGGSNGSATSNPSGGVLPYTYSWSNGQTTSTATGLSAGNYTVTTTDSVGCVNISTITIGQPAAITASTSSTPSSCSSPTGTASASGSGGTPGYSYLWNNGQTTTTATALAGGNYTVTITDANGCTFSDTVNVMNVNAPTLSVTATGTSCNGGTNGNATANVSAGTAPYTYSWNNGQTTTTATGLSAGTYTVVITDAAGCTLTDTISVTQPTAITSSVTSTGACNSAGNGTATVNAGGGTPGYSYSWSNGGTTSQISNLAAQIYSVTITDANGCTGSATVAVSSTTVTASVAGNTTFCSGQSTTLTASGGGTYSWSTGATTSSINISSAGSYSVIVTNGACADTAATNVSVSPGPTANAGASVTIMMGSNTTLTGTGGGTYAWSPSSGLSCTNCSSPAADPSSTTTYTLIVTDANGCTGLDSVTVYVELTDCPTNYYLPNAFSPNDDTENDFLEFYYPLRDCITTFSLTLYDRWGEELYITADPAFKWDGSYEGERLNTQVIIYSLHVIFLDGKDITLKGNVSLVR